MKVKTKKILAISLPITFGIVTLAASSTAIVSCSNMLVESNQPSESVVPSNEIIINNDNLNKISNNINNSIATMTIPEFNALFSNDDKQTNINKLTKALEINEDDISSVQASGQYNDAAITILPKKDYIFVNKSNLIKFTPTGSISENGSSIIFNHVVFKNEVQQPISTTVSLVSDGTPAFGGSQPIIVKATFGNETIISEDDFKWTYERSNVNSISTNMVDLPNIDGISTTISNNIVTLTIEPKLFQAAETFNINIVPTNVQKVNFNSQTTSISIAKGTIEKTSFVRTDSMYESGFIYTGSTYDNINNEMGNIKNSGPDDTNLTVIFGDIGNNTNYVRVDLSEFLVFRFKNLPKNSEFSFRIKGSNSKWNISLYGYENSLISNSTVYNGERCTIEMIVSAPNYNDLVQDLTFVFNAN